MLLPIIDILWTLKSIKNVLFYVHYNMFILILNKLDLWIFPQNIRLYQASDIEVYAIFCVLRMLYQLAYYVNQLLSSSFSSSETGCRCAILVFTSLTHVYGTCSRLCMTLRLRMYYVCDILYCVRVFESLLFFQDCCTNMSLTDIDIIAVNCSLWEWQPACHSDSWC